MTADEFFWVLSLSLTLFTLGAVTLMGILVWRRKWPLVGGVLAIAVVALLPLVGLVFVTVDGSLGDTAKVVAACVLFVPGVIACWAYYRTSRDIVGPLIVAVAGVVPFALVALSLAFERMMDRSSLVLLAMAVPALWLMVEVYERASTGSRKN